MQEATSALITYLGNVGVWDAKSRTSINHDGLHVIDIFPSKPLTDEAKTHLQELGFHLYESPDHSGFRIFAPSSGERGEAFTKASERLQAELPSAASIDGKHELVSKGSVQETHR